MSKKIAVIHSHGKSYYPMQFKVGDVIVVDGVKYEVVSTPIEDYFVEVAE
ncbi:MAG: hypothetical protein LBV67_04485 [Streptococcaceae bacterium]|jgi:hypothetical protein|nr:hypothetical protein [Streptococcaceae bacterium]